MMGLKAILGHGSVDAGTGEMISRLRRAFDSLRECVLDAVKQQVQERQRELERLH
jgi:hypothetical protein